MSRSHAHLWPGVPLALGSAVLFGASAPLSKLLIGAVDPWLLAGVNLTRKLSSADPVRIATLKGLVAGTANAVLALSLGAALPGTGAIAAGAVVGLLGVGVSLVLFMLGLRHLGAARTGAYFSLAPFIGAALGVLLFREPVRAQLLVAGALMALGLWLHLAEQHEHEHVHEALEHEHAHIHDEHHQHAHAPGVPATEPHSHWHRHVPLRHRHPHYPDLHHRHGHEAG